mmetsp:Transcript_1708/g.3803  ORF Transcript_1708/g.3803 Transcript_1708/m.3803 type:complete len:148 (-) Transcript_1708:182-625(-)
MYGPIGALRAGHPGACFLCGHARAEYPITPITSPAPCASFPTPSDDPWVAQLLGASKSHRYRRQRSWAQAPSRLSKERPRSQLLVVNADCIRHRFVGTGNLALIGEALAEGRMGLAVLRLEFDRLLVLRHSLLQRTILVELRSSLQQ